MPYKDKRQRLEAGRRHYAKNAEAVKEKVALNNRLLRQRNREYVNSIKANTPCADCGVIYPPYVMQFDHVSDDKRDNVADLVRSSVSIKTLQTEIDKCELVCSNCHVERTHARAEDFEYLASEWL
jgi:hypothetical protein